MVHITPCAPAYRLQSLAQAAYIHMTNPLQAADIQVNAYVMRIMLLFIVRYSPALQAQQGMSAEPQSPQAVTQT